MITYVLVAVGNGSFHIYTNKQKRIDTYDIMQFPQTKCIIRTQCFIQSIHTNNILYVAQHKDSAPGKCICLEIPSGSMVEPSGSRVEPSRYRGAPSGFTLDLDGHSNV